MKKMILEHHSHVSSIIVHPQRGSILATRLTTQHAHFCILKVSKILAGSLAVQATASISFKIGALEIKEANLTHSKMQKSYGNAHERGMNDNEARDESTRMRSSDPGNGGERERERKRERREVLFIYPSRLC